MNGKDIYGRDLIKGDKVLYVPMYDKRDIVKGGAKSGYIYRVNGFNKFTLETTLEGCTDTYVPGELAKINSVIPERPSVDWTADEIVKLINISPRSPSREQIIDILEARVVIKGV